MCTSPSWLVPWPVNWLDGPVRELPYKDSIRDQSDAAETAITRLRCRRAPRANTI